MIRSASYLRPRLQAPALSIIALVMIVFWPVIGFDFLIYDDPVNIYNNWRVTGFSLANLLHFWQEPYDNLYIPVTYDTWNLLAGFSRIWQPGNEAAPSASIFHAANLLIHTGNVLLVLNIMRSLGFRGWAAWGGAAIFAVHPVQVEPVAWATGLKDLLSGFFSLLAIRQYIVFARTDDRNGLRSTAYALIVIPLILAFLAKPGTAAVPLLLMAIGRLLLGRNWRQLAREIAPLVLLTLPVILLTKLNQPDTRHALHPEFWQRVLVWGDSLAFYLGKLILPLSLGPDYGRSIRVVLDSGMRLYLPIFFPLALLVLAARAGRNWLATAAIFIVALLPVSGLILFDFQNISTVADRYLYLAMLGPAIAVGLALSRCQSKAAWLLFLAAISILSAKSYSQVLTWQDNPVLINHALKINPGSWVMRNNLGIIKADQGLDDEALIAFEKALSANPGYSEAHNNLGALYHKLGRNVEAVNHLESALELDPGNYKSAFQLADIYRDQGIGQKAIEYYRQTLAIRPDFTAAYNNLGLLYLNSRKPREALAIYLQAIESAPPHPMVFFNLARAYAELGMKDQSIHALRRATAIDPDFTPALQQLSAMTEERSVK